MPASQASTGGLLAEARAAEALVRPVGAVDRDRRTSFLIGARAVVTIHTTGRLTCFANDAPFMYWNNKESVLLSVRRAGGQ